MPLSPNDVSRLPLKSTLYSRGWNGEIQLITRSSKRSDPKWSTPKIESELLIEGSDNCPVPSPNPVSTCPFTVKLYRVSGGDDGMGITPPPGPTSAHARPKRGMLIRPG
jgi:hypothetical protein